MIAVNEICQQCYNTMSAFFKTPAVKWLLLRASDPNASGSNPRP